MSDTQEEPVPLSGEDEDTKFKTSDVEKLEEENQKLKDQILKLQENNDLLTSEMSNMKDLMNSYIFQNYALQMKNQHLQEKVQECEKKSQILKKKIKEQKETIKNKENEQSNQNSEYRLKIQNLKESSINEKNSLIKKISESINEQKSKLAIEQSKIIKKFEKFGEEINLCIERMTECIPKLESKIHKMNRQIKKLKRDIEASKQAQTNPSSTGGGEVERMRVVSYNEVIEKLINGIPSKRTEEINLEEFENSNSEFHQQFNYIDNNKFFDAIKRMNARKNDLPFDPNQILSKILFLPDVYTRDARGSNLIQIAAKFSNPFLIAVTLLNIEKSKEILEIPDSNGFRPLKLLINSTKRQPNDEKTLISICLLVISGVDLMCDNYVDLLYENGVREPFIFKLMFAHNCSTRKDPNSITEENIKSIWKNEHQ